MIRIDEITIMQGDGTFEVKRTTPAGLRRKIKRARAERRRRKLEQRTRAWMQGLAMSGGASGLIDAAGVPLIRLLAEEGGLRPELSKALARAGFLPGHDRGQVLVDVAIGLILGARSVRGAAGTLTGSAIVTGPTASAPTAWRMFQELDQAALEKVMKARARHRRAIWTRLAASPEGFPQVSVAGHTWDGWIVVDVDATLVETHSDKEGAAPTYKKHIFGLHPLVATIANTGEVVAILLREGNAGSNTASDHLTVLRQAIAQIPARHRRNIIFRVDGAGATKELLTWIGARAAEQGHDRRYSVGFDVTEPVRTAITKIPADAWSAAITPQGKIRTGAYVADLTGLLKVADGWPAGMAVAARVEPLHPRHHKQASEIEKKRGQRFQAVAHDLPGHHHQRNDVFHRHHATVESVIKDEKDLGLGRFPFYAFAHNQAWCLAAMLAADLLAWLRLLILDHHPELSKASPARLREQLLNVPARLVKRARGRIIRLADDHPHATDLIWAWTKIRALAASPP